MDEIQSYYGRLDEVEIDKSNSMSMFAVNNAMSRMIDKQEQRLIRVQEVIVRRLKKSFEDDLRQLNNTVKKLKEKVDSIEVKVKKKKE